MARIYLDSCIVIYLVEDKATARARLWQQLRDHIVAGQVCLSPLTRMECRVLPLRQQDKILLTKYDFFFRRSGVRFVPIAASVFEMATGLRAVHNIKTADALHLAAAHIGGCAEFWTNDLRLAKAAGENIQMVVPEIAEGEAS